MANTTSNFQPWSGTVNYAKFDIAWGINTGDSTFYYSTQDNNSGYHPSGKFIFKVTNHSRTDCLATISYTYTGNSPLFGPGSLVTITGMSDTTFNYSGMLLDAGSGYIKYISAGFNASSTSDSIGAINSVVSPAWTTGFYFMPSYTSALEGQQNVITAKFEPGYEQRQAASINSNMDVWNLLFLDRSNKEAQAIYNYIQDRAGVYSFQIMIPVGSLVNDTTQKFVGSTPKVSTKSYNINDISVSVREVFDI